MSRLWPALLPELREFPPADQDAALRAARDTALDAFELIGMAIALVLVTALTRYSLPEPGIASRFAAALLNFAVALPMLESRPTPASIYALNTVRFACARASAALTYCSA